MLCRRDFVRYASMGMLAPAFLRPFTAQAADGNGIVIAISLAGGCDGLNTVIPLAQYGTYSQLRTPSVPGSAAQALNIPLATLAATAFDSNPATPSSSASQYAFHPAMSALRTLYGSGRVAVLSGIGVTPDEVNRLSHEVGQFDWNSATVNTLGRSTTGWLGQAFDGTPDANLPAMVSLTGQGPVLMNGKNNAPLVLSAPLEGFSLDTGTSNPADASARNSTFSAIRAETGPDATTEFVRGLSNSAASYVTKVQQMAQAQSAADYPKQTSFIGLQLQQIARLILAGAGSRAYYAVHGGFDSHSNQNQSHPRLVGQLSDAMSTFYNYLKAKGASSNVALMTFTDFGRRAKANANYGTDHGTAAINFVVGDPVRGGVYGQYPDLTKLDTNGNLQIQVDFRNQISDVIQYLGADPSTIVGKSYSKLGFI